MKIGIDLSPTEGNPAGIGQYIISLFSKLAESDTDNQYVTFSTHPLFLPNTENVVVRWPRHFPMKGIRWMIAVSSAARKRKIELLISTSNHMFTIFFGSTFQMIHDLAPLKFPKFFNFKARIIYPLTTRIALNKAKKIITISETVKSELLRLAKKTPPDKIEVVYPALHPWILTKKDSLDDSPYSLPDKYILSLGTLEPRKNYVSLIKGYKAFLDKTNSDVFLVIIGKKGWYYQEIFKTVKTLGLEDKVIFLGYVANEFLGTIYSHASGFAYLSVYEGFGIPPLEALYFDLPVLVSDIPIFHETLGDMVTYADPSDAESVADSLQKLVNSRPGLTKNIVNAKYNWEKSALKLKEVIHKYGAPTDQQN
jgi:glycosyltransferase involved in cell wall biosynthesis